MARRKNHPVKTKYGTVFFHSKEQATRERRALAKTGALSPTLENLPFIEFAHKMKTSKYLQEKNYGGR